MQTCRRIPKPSVSLHRRVGRVFGGHVPHSLSYRGRTGFRGGRRARDHTASPWRNADQSSGLWSSQGPFPPQKVRDRPPQRGNRNYRVREQGRETRDARREAPDLRLSKRHREQGVRSPLGEQGQSLSQLLLQLVDACRLWLRPGETVELGISILEGPVVFHWGAEAQAWGRRGN